MVDILPLPRCYRPWWPNMTVNTHWNLNATFSKENKSSIIYQTLPGVFVIPIKNRDITERQASHYFLREKIRKAKQAFEDKWVPCVNFQTFIMYWYNKLRFVFETISSLIHCFVQFIIMYNIYCQISLSFTVAHLSLSPVSFCLIGRMSCDLLRY